MAFLFFGAIQYVGAQQLFLSFPQGYNLEKDARFHFGRFSFFHQNEPSCDALPAHEKYERQNHRIHRDRRRRIRRKAWMHSVPASPTHGVRPTDTGHRRCPTWRGRAARLNRGSACAFARPRPCRPCSPSCRPASPT